MKGYKNISLILLFLLSVSMVNGVISVKNIPTMEIPEGTHTDSLHDTDIGLDATYDILELSTLNATVGDVIRLNANFSNFDVIGKPGFDIYTYKYENSSDFKYYLSTYFELNSTSNIWYYDHEVSQFDTNTKLVVTRLWYPDGGLNGEHVDLWNINYFSQGDYFINVPDIDIYGTTPDYEPPTLISLSINQSISVAGESIELVINAYDSVSGFRNIFVDVYHDISNEEPYYEKDKYVGDFNIIDVTDPYATEFRLTISVSKYWQTGNYYIGAIEFQDHNGNEIRFENSSLAVNPYSTPHFYVDNDGIEKPKVLNIEFSRELGLSFNDTKLKVTFDLADLDYQGGEISLGYFKNNFLHIFHTFWFYEDEFDPTTGVLEIELSKFNFQLPIVNSNLNIKIFRISLFIGTNQLDFIEETDYSSDTFILVSENNTDKMTVNISPVTPKGVVGQEAKFVIEISSTYLLNFSNIDVDLEISQLSFNEFKRQTIDIESFDKTNVTFSFTFQESGTYSIKATVRTPQIVEKKIVYTVIGEDITTDLNPNSSIPPPELQISVLSILSSLGSIVMITLMRNKHELIKLKRK